MPKAVFDDTSRAALRTIIDLFFPMLVIFGVVHLTDAQVVMGTGFIVACVTFLLAVFKQGQQAGPDQEAEIRKDAIASVSDNS